MKKIALALFIVSAACALAAQLVQAHELFVVSKPLIMAFLLLYYFLTIDREYRSVTLILAMIFSLAGDVLLLNDAYFTGGLAAFLIAHVLYIFTYRQHRSDEEANALQGIQRVRLAFPIVLAGTGLTLVLYPVLGALKIPVILYATVLVLMAITALFRYGRTTSASFWMVFGGAVLFMVSDSLLAINKFLMPVDYAGFLVMLTYIAAQFLIVKGLLQHPHQPEFSVNG